MGEHMKRTRERLEEEFNRISSNETWTKDSIELMKNTLKSMYYIDVICAMKRGEDYPGSEYMGQSYAMSRPIHGGYSGNGYGNSYNNSYRHGMSGRRYYDDEKENAMRRLRQMLDNENNEEVRGAIMSAINELERG